MLNERLAVGPMRSSIFSAPKSAKCQKLECQCNSNRGRALRGRSCGTRSVSQVGTWPFTPDEYLVTVRLMCCVWQIAKCFQDNLSAMLREGQNVNCPCDHAEEDGMLDLRSSHSSGTKTLACEILQLGGSGQWRRTWAIANAERARGTTEWLRTEDCDYE